MTYRQKNFKEKVETLPISHDTTNERTKLKLNLFEYIKNIWKRIKGINEFLLILYFIFIFSTEVIISKHFSWSYFAILMSFIVIFSVIVCPIIIRLLSRINIPYCKEKTNLRLKSAFYLIPLFFFLIYYFAYYPGGFLYDSINQYDQFIYNTYNDWHPVIQTLFAYKLPLTLTGGWIGSVVLFQIICLSTVLGCLFNTILKYTNLKYTIISMDFIFLNPQLGYIVMFPLKDISFAIGILLLMIYSFKIYVTKGNWIKKSLNMVLFIITATLTTLFRHNALLFTVPLILAILFYLTKKRGLVVCLSIIVLCLSIKYPLYSVMNVKRAEQRQVETLGLPMTIIGATVKYTPEALDEETKEFAYKVASKKIWNDEFNGSYNFVKWHAKTNNYVIEEYGSQKIISMMFNCFKCSKRVALTALIKLTRASYTIYDDYNLIMIPYVAKNDFNVKQSGNVKLKSILKEYSDFATQSSLHIFTNLGLMHLLLIASILSKCKLNKLKDWKKIFFIIPVFAYNYGTTFLLTGIEDTLRFFFYTFLLIPILLIFLFGKENERRTDVTVRT